MPTGLLKSLLALILLGTAIPARGGEHPIARPYLGWSSWSLEATEYPGYGKLWLTAEHIRQQSDAMAARLQSHGFLYVNVDANWRGGWDEFGRPTADPRRFPEGIKAIADHVHAHGQKFGIYYVPGVDDDLLKRDPPIQGTSHTIRQIVRQPRRFAHGWGGGHAIDFARPGAREYIRSIAELFASWGVDFLKFDGLTPGSDHRDLRIDGRDDLAAWDEAIGRTGRPIWLTASWDLDMKYNDFWRQHSDAVRIAPDVESYDALLTHWPQVARSFQAAREFGHTAGAGKGWNDLDSLLVGNGRMSGLSDNERRSAATLWAVACSPIYSGDDLTTLDPLGLELLTNDEVLALPQAGSVAALVADDSQGGQVWAAAGEAGSKVVALFNLGDEPRPVRAAWDQLGITGPARVRDLWAHRDLGPDPARFEATLPRHGCRLLRITPGDSR